jgi:hypothetical protein
MEHRLRVVDPQPWALQIARKLPPAQNHSRTCSSCCGRLQDGRTGKHDSRCPPPHPPPPRRSSASGRRRRGRPRRTRAWSASPGSTASRHWRRVASSLLTGRSSSRQCRDRWRHATTSPATSTTGPSPPARDDNDLARLYVRHAGRWRDISRAGPSTAARRAP